MSGEITYMLGIVAAGLVVNFGLRALPFLLFAGKGRELPHGVERFGAFVSPVIIAALILYSYSGLAWKTAWPYLAGVLVVGLQVWKRNPLMSIVAGTVLYMCLLTCGCATRTVIDLDPDHPELRLATEGIYMGERSVPAGELVEALEDADIPKDRTIHILLDRDMKDMRSARALMVLLARGGYTQSVLVTREHSESRTKSGNTYAEAVGLERRSDIDFFVTGEGVTFGLLTRVATTDDVLRCLKEHKVDRGQLIRLNYSKKEASSPDLKRNMDLLRSCLLKAGYANVCCLDVDWRLEKQSVKLQGQPSDSEPAVLGTRSLASPKRVIRYKKAAED